MWLIVVRYDTRSVFVKSVGSAVFRFRRHVVSLSLSNILGQKPFFEHAPTNFTLFRRLYGVKLRLKLAFSSHVAWQLF